MSVAEHFAQTYAEARQKFLAAAESANLDVHSHASPMLGRDGEALAMDVALFGGGTARALLVLSSGCHGVEGFCGSGVQVALLRDPSWHRAAADAGVAVLYLHALNPYGFSWWRRTTHENVDLNRNFQDFSKPLPRNADYDEIAALLVPPSWPPSPELQQRAGQLLAQWGLARLQAAVSAGQYEYPEGLYYGGTNPTWSHLTLRHVLQDHATRCERLGWIDVHTGLGPAGHGERILACRDEPAAMARARRWWGSQVTSLHDGSSRSAPLTGTMWNVVYQECPQAEYTGIAIEYGTVPLMEVIDAMRAEQWLENHPEVIDQDQARAIKRRMRDAFYTDTPVWKATVLEQAFEAAHQAVRGLAE